MKIIKTNDIEKVEFGKNLEVLDFETNKRLIASSLKTEAQIIEILFNGSENEAAWRELLKEFKEFRLKLCQENQMLYKKINKN